MSNENVIEIKKLLDHIEANDHSKIRNALVSFMSSETSGFNSCDDLEELHSAFDEYINNVINVVEEFKQSLPSFKKKVLKVTSH